MEANLEETTGKIKTSENVLIAIKKIQLDRTITLDLLEGKL